MIEFLGNHLNEIIESQEDFSRIALIYKNKSYTYEDVCNESDRFAYLIQQKTEGVVGILLGNRPETIFSIFGAAKAGNTFVILNDKVKPKKLNEIIQDAGISLIITDEQHQKVVKEGKTANVDVLNLDMRVVNPVLADFSFDIKKAYPAAIMYTSGSTGKPKGVVCPHEKMCASARIINDYLKHTSDDVIFTALPLSHGYGLYQVLAPFIAGATVVLEPGFMFAQKALQKIKEHKATGFAVVPSMLSLIFQIDNWKDYLSSLRYITNAGASLPPKYFQKLDENLYPKTDIMPMYGQTECVRALYYKQTVFPYRYESSGIPIPETMAIIVDEDWNVLPPGEIGELVISGPTVMDGYFNNPEETQKTFRVGSKGKKYLFTGDLFTRDEDGYFYYVGRKDDVIKIKGERTSPRELEDALFELDGVREVAVVTVPDDDWGNRFVVHYSSVNLTITDILRYIKFNCEPHMLPKDVRSWGTIPKNDNGKIDRKYLKQISE